MKCKAVKATYYIIETIGALEKSQVVAFWKLLTVIFTGKTIALDLSHSFTLAFRYMVY